MPRKIIDFSLDLFQKDILPVCSLKQFDECTLNINLKSNGEVYNATGCNSIIYISCGNDVFKQDTNITVNESTVKILLKKEMLQKYGKALAEIELINSDGVITSTTFILNIEGKIGEGSTIPGEIEGFVEKYERLIREFKEKVDTTVESCNTRVDNKLDQLEKDYNTTKNEVIKKTDNKIVEIDKRFNQLTAQQQQDLEVLNSRDGEISLKVRLDRDLKYEDGKNVKDKIADIEGLKEIQNLNYSTDKGYVVCENTKNGLIDNLAIKGKTLVNLSNSTRTSLGGGATYEGSVITLPKNGYISFLCTDNTYLQGKTLTVKYFAPLQIGNSQLRACVRYIDTQNTIKEITSYTYNNEFKIIVPDVEYKKIIIYIQNTKDIVVTQEYKIVCVEGDFVQNLPLYFEKIKSVGDLDELEISSNNSNLLNLKTNLTNSITNYDTTILDNGFITKRLKAGSGFPLQFKIKIEKNKDYVFKCSHVEHTGNSLQFYVYGYYNGQEMDLNNTTKRGAQLRQGVTIRANESIHFNTGDFDFIGVGFYYSNSTVAGNTCTVLEPMISSSNVNVYTPYKKHTKKLLYKDIDGTWKKPILRKWDYIEELENSGYKYYKCSEECILNGNEDGWYSVSGESVTTVRFGLYLDKSKHLASVLCDTFIQPSDKSMTEDVESITIRNNSLGKPVLYIRIAKSKLTSEDLTGFKAYLQANPIIVVYELAQEEVYECTSLTLNSYEDETIVQVTSGPINPRLEFSITSHINNLVLSNRDRINYLEEKFTESLKKILAGDMQSLAYMLYPEDFKKEACQWMIKL